MKLPNNPSGLPDSWVKDPRHKDPNGERWINPDTGDILDWHPGQEGKPGWRGKDHWHYRPGGKGGKEHLPPGTEIPDPENGSSCNISPLNIKPLPWYYYLPELLLMLNPFATP
jgi:hypothetical protein